MSSSQESSEMFDPDNLPEYFLSEPDHYIAAHGLMIGTTENIEDGDNSPKCLSLIFIDTRDELHPVLLHPKGELLQYIISDEFREVVNRLLEKLVDTDTGEC